jgi:death-on-curing protein
MRPLTLDEVEYIALALARNIMTWDEPIPDFNSRIPGRLESCIQAPFQTYDGVDLHPTLADKAAAQFYYMIKSHPFKNGNKRLAVTTLLVFLDTHDKWLGLTSKELYDLAINVANSDAELSQEIIHRVSNVFTTLMLIQGAAVRPKT